MLEAVWASTECVEAGSASAERAAAAAEWARRQFSEVESGDVRRTRRVVKLAAQMAAQPQASWPKQAGSWAASWPAAATASPTGKHSGVAGATWT